MSELVRFWRRLGLHSLRRGVLLGVVLVGVLAVANILTVHYILRQSDDLAATVNLAGNLRMLSQRMTQKVLLLHEGNRAQTLADLRALETRFQLILAHFEQGNILPGHTLPVLPDTLLPGLESLDHAWQTYSLYLINPGAWAATHDGTLEQFLRADGQLLEQTESFVGYWVRHAERVQDRMLFTAYALFAFNCALLILAWLLLRRSILRPISALMDQCRALSAGHFDARSRFTASEEMNALGRALNESAAHIQNLLARLQQEHAALQRAEASNRQAALVYRHTSEAMVVTDPDGHIQDINPAFTAITGYQIEEVRGRSMAILGSGHHDTAFYRQLWNCLNTTGQWSGDIHNRRKSGETYIEHLTISTSYNDDGSVKSRVGLFSDVTQKRKQEALIWYQAHHDQLTDLPNRQLFHDTLNKSIASTCESGASFALLFLDLDNFKEVNDKFGHHEGDRLLQIVAERLKSCVAESDCVARLGGDEFTILVHGVQQSDEMQPICDNILQVVASPCRLGGSAMQVSVSIGVTFCPHDGVSAADLLRFADLAMYVAKAKGRNQYSFYSGRIHDRIRERRDLQADLAHALNERRLILHFQPLVDMCTGRVVCAETLLRWLHPEKGLLEPVRFIDLAEDSGLIIPFGDWVFRQAVDQLARWRARHDPDFTLSINVSPVQFHKGGLEPAAWADYMQSAGVPCSAFTLEITESLLMQSDDHVLDRLRRLREAGFGIALDDFGTGYSSFTYLKRFSLDCLKIDRSFVNHLAEDSEDLVLCQAIAAMAQQLGLKVVAEGVRNETQRGLLLAMGCQVGQGAGYSAPLPAEAFEALFGQVLAVSSSSSVVVFERGPGPGIHPGFH
ncbi:EAL domain-containing protein [Castellaniella sp.]|uniref:EAL domain-containing protein n=1 Tax=Castellaniella sp. TaxID=1955812 RepID=UPI00355F2A7F